MEIDIKCSECGKGTRHFDLGEIFYLPDNASETIIVRDAIVCPKHRKEEFELAKDIKEVARVKITGEKQASGIIFCGRIAEINRNNLNEKQIQINLKWRKIKLMYPFQGICIGLIH